jgi:hypothetical protein
MSEYSAKTLREKMKSKARALAGAKDQKTDSSDWSPAPLLRTEAKTGARPIMKPSAKGIGESNAARDTKAAIGNPKRGAFKSGGAVKRADGGSAEKKYVNISGKRVEDTPEAKLAFAKKTFPNITEVGPNAEPIFPKPKKNGGGIKDKKALGAIDPSPKRGPAGHYKKGGKIGKDDGGIVGKLNRLTGYKSPAQKLEEGLSGVGKGRTSSYSSSDKSALSDIAKGGSGSTLPSDETEFGKSQNYKKGGRTKRATGGLINTMKTGKKGSKKGAKTDINIVINAGHKAPARHPAAGLMPPGADAGMPSAPPPGAGAPPPAMPPMGMPPGGGPGMPPGLPMGRKAGGRISKVASSYKNMTSGSGSGLGREQKTSIAEKHKGAPTRKTGGRAVKSYKQMDAGSGSGMGRIEKTAIEKRHKDAPSN